MGASASVPAKARSLVAQVCAQSPVPQVRSPPPRLRALSVRCVKVTCAPRTATTSKPPLAAARRAVPARGLSLASVLPCHLWPALLEYVSSIDQVSLANALARRLCGAFASPLDRAAWVEGVRRARVRERAKFGHVLEARRIARLAAEAILRRRFGYGDCFWHKKVGTINTWRGETGVTRLCNASFRGRADEVEALLALGAHVNASGHWEGFTALHFAAFMGHARLVAPLVAAGGEVDATTRRNSVWAPADLFELTPLHMAAWLGRTDAAAALLAAGADVNLFGQSKTPLNLAIESGCVQTAELLRRHGGLVAGAS